MYGAVLPSYRSRKSESDSEQEIIKADDPRNRDRVRKFLEDIE